MLHAGFLAQACKTRAALAGSSHTVEIRLQGRRSARDKVGVLTKANRTMAANTPISAKKIAALVTDGFEQAELTGPKEALEAAGAQVRILAPKGGSVQGFHHTDKADSFPVDGTIADARPEDFDALLLPGGVQNADALRVDEDARAFAKAIAAQGKPIAVICHGPWLLIDAGLVQGRTMTSWPSLKVDLSNAGAHWVDAQVHVDQQLISSRKPDDIPAFNEQFLKVLGAGT